MSKSDCARRPVNGALQLPDQTVTVQVRDGKMSATDGPYMETKEMLAGFLVIEARDLNEAVRIGAGIPHAKTGSLTKCRPAPSCPRGSRAPCRSSI